MGFAWNLILFSFVREREGYKHHADCTVLVVVMQQRHVLFTIADAKTSDSIILLSTAQKPDEHLHKLNVMSSTDS